MINLLRSGLLLFILTLLAALLFWLNQTGRSPLSMQEDTSGRAADYIVENFSAIRTEGDGTGRYMLFGKKNGALSGRRLVRFGTASLYRD